ncbi:MAG: flagellar biosynthetic protein FliR [Cohaesibacter sp.]|jgi:flagellar biosynthetic protein FliR|nr:flagellar biosynthetic protein FliR [Cohaesibacter sp.]
MLLEYLPQTAFIFMLIFARFGTLFMLLPAFSERNIAVRIRLTVALMFTLMMYPIVSTHYGTVPANLIGVLVAMGKEIVIAMLIGLSIRLVTSALQIGATTIAFQMGLSFAMGPDSATGGQSVTLGRFMSTVAVTLIFVTDLHYVMIVAMHDSYTLFPVNQGLPVGDMAEFAVQTVAGAFVVGTKIAAPFIVYGLVFYFGLGLLSRLMPQLQVFFIAMPANITIGLILFMMLLITIMTWYMGHLEEVLGRFVAS